MSLCDVWTTPNLRRCGYHFRCPHDVLTWISIQQKLLLARQIVTELSETQAHERQNEGELPDQTLAKS